MFVRKSKYNKAIEELKSLKRLIRSYMNDLVAESVKEDAKEHGAYYG